MEKTTTPLDVEQTELLTLPFVGIVIPALDPDQRLLTLLQQLLQLDQLTKKSLSSMMAAPVQRFLIKSRQWLNGRSLCYITNRIRARARL